jgi:hypothetical protein
MKAKMYQRLAQLEQINAARAADRYHKEEAAGAIEQIRHMLQDWGVVQEPQESLAETTSRALGITCRELDNLLRGDRSVQVQTESRLLVPQAFCRLPIDSRKKVAHEALAALDDRTREMLEQFRQRGVPQEDATDEERLALIRCDAELQKAAVAWEANR